MANRLLKLAVGVAVCNIIALPTGKPYEAHAEGEEPSLSIGGAEASSEQEALSSYDEVTSSESEGSSADEASSEAPSEEKKEEEGKATDEALKTLEDYIAQLEKQIKDLSDTKFLNGTIGGLVSSALTLLAYAIVKIAERKGWKSRTELFARANGLLDTVSDKVEDLHKTEALSDEQYRKATDAVSKANELLSSTNSKLSETDAKVEEMKAEVIAKYDETMKTLESDYAELMDKYSRLIGMIKELAKGDPELIKSGTYEKIESIGSKASSEGE